MYRRIVNKEACFAPNIPNNTPEVNFDRISIQNSEELEETLREKVKQATADGKAALALSGGIDSAILAKMMPKGSTAYTFKCVVPGVHVTDETGAAARYARENGLVHKIVEIRWEDVEKYASILMRYKGAPIHSIEVQIYKASLHAKADGFERIIYGESADCVFGGLSDILSRDWKYGDFVDRYAYVKPYVALKEPKLVLDPIIAHVKDGYVDPHEFMSTEFYPESVGSYINASKSAGMGLVVPYAECVMDIPLDYNRVRSGENKYLVREVFNRLYPDFQVPPKTPMPRPTNEWFKDWQGPTRQEFWPNCVDGMNGDQKWLLWALEKFLNLIE